MSRKMHIDSVSEADREQIMKDLQIKMEGSTYVKNSQTSYIYPIEVTEDHAYIPFSYGRTCAGGPFECPERNEFGKLKCKFEGSLREHQKEVKTEAISHLNKYGSTIIAAYPGYGKCHGYNTPILMFDGTIKMVQDILKGDELMGDDSKVRNVQSTCQGYEQMYDIIQSNGDTYRVNESHILSLTVLYSKSCNKYVIKELIKFICDNFNREEQKKYKDSILNDNILDIEVRYYLKLSRKVKDVLKGYKVAVSFKEKLVKSDPYLCKKIYGNIPHDYKCNSRRIQMAVLAGIIDSDGYYVYEKNCYEIIEKREKIAHDIEFICRSIGLTTLIKKVGNKNYIVSIFGDNLEYIPIKKNVNNILHYSKNQDTLLSEIEVLPVKEDNYYGFTLDGNHRYLLGDFTVTHNTAMGIYIATKIKLKTLIVSHRIVLINQWKDSINKFCPGATVQVLTAKSVMKDCDFYIMNPANVPKHDHEFYKDIGFMIVDEVHLIMAEGLSKCMQRIVPRYVIGLSATPYREDGLNMLLDLYFGNRKIYRKLFRKHNVYKINTSFVPTVELAKNGRVNWGVILDTQCNDMARNDMIVRLVKFFPKRVFLVLCKRINQGNYLVKKLLEEGEDVTSLIGKQQEFEQKSRILVGISSKVGTGFDHPRLDALILASDIQAYFIQYLGRCMRTQEGVPMIFDLVDKNPILDKHFKVRRATYIEHGGSITEFSKKYPDFEVI